MINNEGNFNGCKLSQALGSLVSNMNVSCLKYYVELWELNVKCVCLRVTLHGCLVDFVRILLTSNVKREYYFI